MAIKLFYFLLLLFCVTAVYWIAIPRNFREKYLFIISTGIVFSLDVVYGVYFSLMIVIVYYISEHIRNNGKYRTQLFKGCLTWLVINLLFFKYINILLGILVSQNLSLFGDFLPEIAFPIGVSYFSFRLIHYIFETYRSNLPQASLLSFASYMFFFPTFLSGPVERFHTFQPQSTNPKPLNPHNVTEGLYRILLGLFRKYIIADSIGNIIMPVLWAPGDYAGWVVLLCIYGLIFRIYMDLAGYTDIAIGTAKLFGYSIMENFNRPLLQRNIGLYWRNWHISVYTWIRDYFFFPVFGYRSSPLKIYTGSFLIVFLFMVWHAGTLGYVLAGLYHGLGILIWQLFQSYTKPHRQMRQFFNKPAVGYVSVFITYNFISFGVLLYTFNTSQITHILNSII